MTDFEWPPDEIAGPPTEENKVSGRASAAVPPGQSAPAAGVPMPVAGPQSGIPMAPPQPLPGGPVGAPIGLPNPPQRPQPPMPSNGPAPIAVQPHLPPVPVTPPSGAPVSVPPPSGLAPPSSAPPATGSAPVSTPPAGPRHGQPPGQAPVQPQAPFPAPSTGQPVSPGQMPPPPPPPPTIAHGSAPVMPPPAQPGPPRPMPPQSPPPTGVFPVVPHQQPAMPPQQQTPGGPRHIPSTAPGPASGEVYLPTAEEFARRRSQRPADPVAYMGMQAALRKSTFGLINLSPGQREQQLRKQTELVRRNFGGLRQITVVNPKGGAGKTCAVLLLAMTFGRKRGGYVLAWDNNETQGTLGMRSQQDFHSRTVRDLLRDLPTFQGVNSRVGDLSQYVRAQGDGMFEVLASDESATAGEMLTADAFAEIREVVSRFYKLIMVDTGNNVRAENWQAAIDATDQLVVTMSARNDSAETAARMLDHLEQTGRSRLVRQAVSIVSLPPSRKELDIPAIERHFAARTRAVLIAPYERMLDSGEPIDYARLSQDSQDAWLAIAAAVAEGL